MLLETVRNGSVAGVRVLLKHGAQPDLSSWGDGIEQTPLELAQDQPEILAPLRAAEPPNYIRKADPPLPQGESPEEGAINRQGELRDQTGLVFQTPSVKPPE